MSRSLRIEFPGAFYHVMARGNRRETIFHDDDDRRFFLATLSTPISPPSGPTQWLFQGPPAESKLLAAQERIYRTPAEGIRKFLRLRMELAE